MFIGLILITLVSAYIYLKWHYSYWKRKGVKQIKPSFVVGNFKELFMAKTSLGDLTTRFYKEFKSKGLKYGGVYESFTPSFIPLDLEIVKCIMLKDFNHFINHGYYVNLKADPLSGHLLSLNDEHWKNMRATISTTFTTGKLKMMFPIMNACCDELTNILKENAKLNKATLIQEVVARLIIDISISVAFGLESNTLKNPDSEFRRYSRQVTESTGARHITRLITSTFPRWLIDPFKIRTYDQEVTDFFTNVIRNTVEYREANDIYRKDFLHMLLQLKNKGSVSNDGDFKPAENEDGNYISFQELAALSFGFYIAGFTGASAITMALLELAKNQEIQNKLRSEILSQLEKCDNKITYESIMEMTYLDKIVYETLRRYAPTQFTGRICNETYKIPHTDVVLEKGNKVLIPIAGIQMDPDYYPDPEKFDPERFNAENISKRPTFSFLAFGEGPRMCLGARFGLLQKKITLVTIIKDFQITLNPKSLSTDAKEVWLDLHYLR